MLDEKRGGLERGDGGSEEKEKLEAKKRLKLELILRTDIYDYIANTLSKDARYAFEYGSSLADVKESLRKFLEEKIRDAGLERGFDADFAKAIGWGNEVIEEAYRKFLPSLKDAGRRRRA